MNIAILILAIGLFLIVFSDVSKADLVPRPQKIVIRSNDNLWTIAQTVRPDQDPRKTLEAIRNFNHLDNLNIRPGQEIMVP